MNIYIGNHYNVNEEELKEIFKEYGEVMSVKIITDKSIPERARDLVSSKCLMMKKVKEQ